MKGMSAVIVTLLMLLITIVLAGIAYIYITTITPSTSALEKSCTSSGGTVGIGMCCLSTFDFPNTCLIGACGCSPTNSHSVITCECPSGKCFDGTYCVSGSPINPA